MTLGLFGRQREQPEYDEQTGDSRWSIAKIRDNTEGKKTKVKSPFSIWSATKYILVLSILLWWLPVFGQMIAGYVGGRRAGSPWKGVAAAILPVIAIISVMTAIDYFLPQMATGNGPASASLLQGFVAAVPFIGPYLDFTREYVTQFIASLQGASPYEMNSYFLTIAFAYIGGIISEQAKREIESASAQPRPQTTVMVAPAGVAPAYYTPQYRRTLVTPEGHGYAGNILSFFHLQRRPTGRRFDQMVSVNPSAATRASGATGKKKKLVRKQAIRSSVDINDNVPMAKVYSRQVKSMRSRKTPQVKRSPVKMRADKHRRIEYQSLRINPKNPKSLMRAEKLIEMKWNPKKRRKPMRVPIPPNRTKSARARAAILNRNSGGWGSF